MMAKAGGGAGGVLKGIGALTAAGRQSLFSAALYSSLEHRSPLTKAICHKACSDNSKMHIFVSVQKRRCGNSASDDVVAPAVHC